MHEVNSLAEQRWYYCFICAGRSGDVGAERRRAQSNCAVRERCKVAPREEKERRQEDFLKYIQRLLGDCDTRIKRAKEQVKQRQREALAANGISPETQEEIEMKIEILDEKINSLVGEAETLGNSGEVEEAKGRFKLADELKNEKQELQDSIKIRPQIGETGQFGPAREMEVCDTCGALVEIYVASNVEDHNNGKMHAGFVRLKASAVIVHT